MSNSFIKPEEIDFDLIINEVDTEVAAENGWRDDTLHLARAAEAENTELVYVTDCEGEFVCIASREMAEYICKQLNPPHCTCHPTVFSMEPCPIHGETEGEVK